MFLNIIRVKNFYETYSDLLKMPMMFSPEAKHSSNKETSSEKDNKDIQEPMTNSFEDTSSTSNEETLQEQNFNPLSNMPFFPSDLTSMLNEEQKETLDLLKTLFSQESS